MIDDIKAAAMLLTRIPMPSGNASNHANSTSSPSPSPTSSPTSSPSPSPITSRCYWAFPLIGVLVSALPALIATALAVLGTPLIAAAALMILGTALLSGGMHQDGLADIADSLGGTTPQKRLEIIHDSRIGPFGTIALITSIIINTACLAALGETSLALMPQALVATAALSRSMMGGQRFLHPTPENTGLAHAIGTPAPATALLGLALALGISAVLLNPIHALALMACGIIITLMLGRFLRFWLGGVNGDGLGATQQCSETAMLITLAILVI